MLNKKKLFFSIALAISASNSIAQPLTIEEQRIKEAVNVMPTISFALSERVNLFADQVNKAKNLTVLSQLAIRHGKGIWNDAKKQFKNSESYDDRPLYWSRLIMNKAIKQTKAYKDSLPSQREKLIWQFELYSRGQTDVNFDKKTSKRILITGFDPTNLDNNIQQSNISGIAALELDDLVISNGGKSVEIETLILPVRLSDLDNGMVETLLTPYFRTTPVDMIINVSMGDIGFTLERFAGLQRNSDQPDNLNVTSGINTKPAKAPMLRNKLLAGPKFIAFTLPAKEMLMINEPYAAQLNNKDSGTKDRFISNEVSYRSMLLRDLYSPVLPVGHITTPSVTEHSKSKSKRIVSQLKVMITKAVETL